MIGIGITTKNRVRQLKKTVAEIRRHTTNVDYYIHVVNDGGKPIENWRELGIDAYTENPESLGIPSAKNQNLVELLRHTACNHIFLFDDDTFPIQENWHSIFIDLNVPHSMYIFASLGNQTRGIRKLGSEGNLGWYDHVRGCLLYYRREVIEQVGGFDLIFGIGMYEHTDLSDRIHAFGLTKHPYNAPLNGSEYIYCLDQDQAIISTFDRPLRNRLIRTNRPLKMQRRGKRIYVDPKTGENSIR